jgi:hypothetical protein
MAQNVDQVAITPHVSASAFEFSRLKFEPADIPAQNVDQVAITPHVRASAFEFSRLKFEPADIPQSLLCLLVHEIFTLIEVGMRNPKTSIRLSLRHRHNFSIQSDLYVKRGVRLAPAFSKNRIESCA